MIYLKNLHKRFGHKELLKEVSFHLRPKERVALIGENGMGKTTLFRIITKQEGTDSGSVSIRKGAHVGLLEQVLEPWPGSVLERVVLGDPRFREVKERMEGLHEDRAFHDRDPEGWARQLGEMQTEFERMGGYDRESRAQTLLAGLGFKTKQMEKPLTEFSGGWRMRVELAKLLLQNPDVLLLDEPTNHLDLRSVVWLEAFLKQYEGSLLLISHDRRFINNLVTRVIELDRGKLTIYPGVYDDYERLKAEREAQLESQAVNQRKRIAELERFIERFRAKNTKATQAKSKQKQLDKMERIETATSTKTVQFRFPQPKRTGRMVLDLKNIDKSYGPLNVYNDFSIQLERGTKVALVGENGAGKSTLLKLMAGNIQPDSGEIELGANVTRSYFAQHNTDILDAKHTVLQSLEETAGHLMLTKKRSILGAFLFSGEDAEKKVGVLSGGERARLALARMLADPAALLLLDEPTNHLDIRSCEVLAAALSDFDGTIAAISHDRFFLDGIINRVWEVENGVVREYHGNYSDYEYAKAKETETETIAKEVKDSKPSQGKKDKDRKRKEAEERNARYRKLKPLEKRLKKIEADLEKVMEKKSSIETQLADQSIYDDENKTRLMDALACQKDLQKEETTLLSEWDTLTAEREALGQPETS